MGDVIRFPLCRRALMRASMIGSSPSWRRFWMPWRWAHYPWVA